MRRRRFLALLGAIAAGWPLGAHVEQAGLPIIGVLSGNRFDERELSAMRQGLSEAGTVEGRDLAIEYRSAEGQYERLPALAADLVRRPVAVVVAIGGTVSALAAKAATATIPIVFSNGGDPIKVGLVPSLNRPGGNITGVSFFVNALGAKRLELLHEIVPAGTAIGFLANPGNPNTDSEARDVETAARAVGQQFHIEKAGSEGEIETAFASFIRHRTSAVVVSADAFFLSRRDGLAAIAARHRLPTICDVREHALAGCLMSYGTDRTDAYRQAGIYAAKVLKGERPADLPVMQSTKFEWAINLATARTLGLAVPQALLALADEVIE